MAEIIKETISTQENNSKFQTTELVIYYILGAIEILLAFRLVLKLAGASLRSAFVYVIYSLSSIFILPFEGIFRRGYAQGVETTSVLEPSTLVALAVYAVLAWGIVKLLRIFSKEEQNN